MSTSSSSEEKPESTQFPETTGAIVATSSNTTQVVASNSVSSYLHTTYPQQYPPGYSYRSSGYQNSFGGYQECPVLKPPTAPEPEIDFCPECMKAHPPGQCISKLCKTQGHLEADCPWLREAQANIKLPLGEKEEKEPEVQICLHCRSNNP